MIMVYAFLRSQLANQLVVKMIRLQVVSIFILLLMTSLGAYRHTIVVSNNQNLSHCNFIITKYHCGSLVQAFDLLNRTKKSVDITIEPAEYTLVSSHILESLQDVKIMGSAIESAPVIITC